jgi:hypothetical protein
MENCSIRFSVTTSRVSVGVVPGMGTALILRRVAGYGLARRATGGAAALLPPAARRRRRALPLAADLRAGLANPIRSLYVAYENDGNPTVSDEPVYANQRQQLERMFYLDDPLGTAKSSDCTGQATAALPQPLSLGQGVYTQRHNALSGKHRARVGGKEAAAVVHVAHSSHHLLPRPVISGAPPALTRP